MSHLANLFSLEVIIKYIHQKSSLDFVWLEKILTQSQFLWAPRSSKADSTFQGTQGLSFWLAASNAPRQRENFLTCRWFALRERNFQEPRVLFLGRQSFFFCVQPVSDAYKHESELVLFLSPWNMKWRDNSPLEAQRSALGRPPVGLNGSQRRCINAPTASFRSPSLDNLCDAQHSPRECR
jgi:hypothetical protein